MLKFGIICDDTSIPRWQAECVRELVATGNARLTLVVIEPEANRRGSWQRRFGKPSTWLFRAWCGALVYPRVPALRPVPLDPHLPYLRVVWAPANSKQAARRYASADVAAIEAYGLDFIIRFKSTALAGEILAAARWGVWSYGHGDGRLYQGIPPGFRELRREAPVQGATLQRLASEGVGAVVLHRGTFRTRPTYARNLNALLLGSTDWAARAARELSLDGTRCFDAAVPSAADVGGGPTNGEFVLYLAGRSRALARGVARKLMRREDWNIGIVNKPMDELMRDGVPGSVAWFPEPPADGFLADPVPFKHREEVYVLAEEYDHRTQKGHIVAARMVEGKLVAGLAPALRSPHHLSYPFLFDWEGATYCVPERSEGGGVPLYRATRFPIEWTYVGTMIEEFPALDSTIFEHGGYWWLFCTRAGDLSEYKLHAWYAATPLGPWTPHALNPLKCDVTSSRPAGPAFRIEQELFRPAQDGSRTYGGAITFNRVKTLTPTSFAEETVAKLSPDPDGPYPNGLHTICTVGRFTVIDGKRHQRISPLRRLRSSAARFVKWRDTRFGP